MTRFGDRHVEDSADEQRRRALAPMDWRRRARPPDPEPDCPGVEEVAAARRLDDDPAPEPDIEVDDQEAAPAPEPDDDQETRSEPLAGQTPSSFRALGSLLRPWGRRGQ